MLIYNNISDDSRDFRYSILKMATQHWCFCFQSCTRTGLKSHSHSRLSWHGVTIQWLCCKAVLMADKTNLFSRCQRKQNLSQGISTCSKSTAKPVRAGWKNDSRFMWRQWEEAYRTLFLTWISQFFFVTGIHSMQGWTATTRQELQEKEAQYRKIKIYRKYL